MKTKAIFLDVDGTLISFKTHKIPQTTIDALNQVHNNGIKIIIATGRVATDLGELDAIPYDAVVALNGSHCLLRDGTEITSRQISHEDFRIVRNLAEKYGFPLALEVDKGIFVNYVNDTVIALSELTNHPIPLVVDIDKELKKKLPSLRKRLLHPIPLTALPPNQTNPQLYSKVSKEKIWMETM